VQLSGNPHATACRAAALSSLLLLALAGALPVVDAGAQEAASPEALAAAGGGAAAAEPIPVETVPVAYEDRYLYEDSGTAGSIYTARDSAPEPYGRRYIGLESQYYSADDDLLGDDLEQGLAFRYGRETLNWGTIDVEASLADIESDHLSREASGTFHMLTLRQSAVPVSNTGILNATVGHLRLVSSSILQNSYRLSLPTSVMRGVSSEVRSNGNGVRFTLGDAGQLQGMRIPRFEENGGRLTSLAVDREIGERFAVGVEVSRLRNDDDVRDHTSVLIGARYRPTAAPREHAARFMRDDDDNIAFWSDNRHDLASATTLRYGIFHFDPEVVWADLPINRNQQGLYVQADAVNATLALGGGYDYQRYGLETEAPTSYDKHSVFFNGSLRLSRALTLGLHTSFADRSLTGDFIDEQTISRLNLFSSIAQRAGTLRLDLFVDEVTSPNPVSRRERQGASASVDWAMPERLRLTTEVRIEDNLDLRGRTRREELSTLFRFGLMGGVSLGLNASLYRTGGLLYEEEGGLSLSADASWSFLDRWTGTATLYQNQASVAAADFLPGAMPGESGTSSFWLSVRYQQSSGQRFAEVGRRYDGTSGSGSLDGQVFFDANRDGIRQPSEEPAVGVTIVLDGRYETRTDQNGYYSFVPVPTGDHEIIALMDNLPLPWGLEDETPRRARVAYRTTATVGFPLIVMN
jgi:hypothetical protein